MRPCSRCRRSRGHSAGTRTAAQLHDDISSAMVRGAPEKPGRKNRQDYLLGPMIVTRGRTNDVFEVIDGQQRLVTLTILLSVLRDSHHASRDRRHASHGRRRDRARPRRCQE